MDRNKGLIISETKKHREFYSNTEEFRDVVGEFILRAYITADKFESRDNGRGGKIRFSTYFVRSLRSFGTRLQGKYMREVGGRVRLNNPLPSDDGGEHGDLLEDSRVLSPVHGAELAELDSVIDRDLSYRERKVLLLRYAGGKWREVGEEIGRDRETARQVGIVAFRRLKEVYGFGVHVDS